MRMILCLRDHRVPFIHFPPWQNFLDYALVNVHLWSAWSPVLSLCDTRSVIVTCYRRRMHPQPPRNAMCNDMPAKICLTVLPYCLRHIQEPEDSGASISDCLPRRDCSLGCVADHALATVRHHVRCTSYPLKIDKGSLCATEPNAEAAKRKGRWDNSLLRSRCGMNKYVTLRTALGRTLWSLSRDTHQSSPFPRDFVAIVLLLLPSTTTATRLSFMSWPRPVVSSKCHPSHVHSVT